MNIFPLEGNIDSQTIYWWSSAESLDNYRIVKMPTECCQILSTAMRELGGDKFAPDKSFNPKHPCNIWATESNKNFLDLIHWCEFMLLEYHLRFPRGKHSADQKLIKINNWFAKAYTVVDDGTKLPFCLPDQFNDGNIITSYRKFYSNKPNLRYPVSKIPEWLSDYRDLKTIQII